MDVMTEGISHTPFIIASYAVAAVLLAWCALAPRFRRKAAIRSIRKLIKLEGSTRDTDS